MEQWLRDALAEEIGYTICPIRGETYTICNNDCDHCQDNINFIKDLEEIYNKKEYIDERK